MEMSNLFKMSLAVTALSLAACDKTDRSFSILSTGETFQQTVTYVPRKIDILWVVDNSGSMQSSQSALTANFSSFINKFKDKSYDFHMAVQSSDAWLGKFNNQNDRRRFKDGVGSNHSGVFVMDKNTPNINNVFVTNATLGINGSGDERAFSSFLDTLDYSVNSDFRRNDAYLAIIIVSDEDDFSATTSTYLENNYNHPSIIPVANYVTFLNSITLGPQDYSVNTIQILDQTCLDTLNAQSPGRRIGTRYIQLANLTGGVKASLCSNFGDTLELISDRIAQQVSVFKLTREPIPETIRVTVNGQQVASHPVNGWTYDPAAMTISFATAAAPSEGDSVSITFDPKTLNN